jgi:SHAQKYF class myb-like DNA-binding protein
MNPNDLTITTCEMVQLQNYHICMLQAKCIEAQSDIEKLKIEVKELRGLWREEENAPKLEKKVQFWTEEEHARFLDVLEVHGAKNVREIAKQLGGRTPARVRSHIQKHFIKLRKYGESPVRAKRASKSPNTSESPSTKDQSSPIPMPPTSQKALPELSMLADELIPGFLELEESE